MIYGAELIILVRIISEYQGVSKEWAWARMSGLPDRRLL
jgi:hypothetical protein